MAKSQMMPIDASTLWTIEDMTPISSNTSLSALADADTPPVTNNEREALYVRFSKKIRHNPALDRTLVSFQANKSAPFYSWFKYREGFSSALVHYLLRHLHLNPGILLDPFAGGGSALFAGSTLGWQTIGIEVLPTGVYAMNALDVAHRIDCTAFVSAVEQLAEVDFAKHYDARFALHHIAITRGAFPEEQERQLIGYLAYCHAHVVDENVRSLLLFAAFCVLEEMSYTRKDGQYLRWDARSGRSQGKKPFHKGKILSFREAVDDKLRQMATDLSVTQPELFADMPGERQPTTRPDVRFGSCLELLPDMPDAAVDFVLTSPPYANRYDYTRTYALELVFLGCTDEEVKRLRQAMLSCTVENKTKREQLKSFYHSRGRAQEFQLVDETFQNQGALQEVLAILDAYREAGKLNNDNIARLVHNYFYEMCFVIYELSRVLKPGGVIAMVNDNVRYAGEEVPVDLILSDFAESFGLKTRHIWTLGRGKGNSSQQMGNHGRTELRKCVYVWEK